MKNKSRYFLFDFSSNFKQCFYGLGILCFIISLGLIINGDKVTGGLGGYSPEQAAVLLSILGFMFFIFYHVLAKLLSFEYKQSIKDESNEDQWLK